MFPCGARNAETQQEQARNVKNVSTFFFCLGEKGVLQTPYLKQAVLLLIFTSPPQLPARDLYVICLLGNESHLQHS